MTPHANHSNKVSAVILPMFLGIGIAAALLTYIASLIIERKNKKMHGDIDYTGRAHILIVGYTPETTGIIDQILRDGQRKQGILYSSLTWTDTPCRRNPRYTLSKAIQTPNRP